LSSKKDHIEDDIPFEEKDRIWNLIFEKISDSIKRKQNFAILFSTSVGGKTEEGYSAIITDDQYHLLLESFIAWSEEQERYETCLQAKKLIKELESWKKMN
jgi:hypothetical protein